MAVFLSSNNFTFIVLSLFCSLFFKCPKNKAFTKEKTIVLAADNWCPYNCNSNSKNPGYVVEIAKAIFEPRGYEITYQETSWSRAIFGTKNGDFNGIIGTGKNETPDLIFPDCEVGISSHTFYVLESNSWVYEGLESLKNIALGVIDNYSYGSFNRDYVKPNKNNPKLIQSLSGNNALERNLQKLKEGKIDAIIEDEFVLKYFIANNNLDINIKEAGVAHKEDIYLAFSPVLDESKEYAVIFSLGLEELRKTGELKKILDKYGLKDWRK